MVDVLPAAGDAGVYQMFLRDLVVRLSIGVHEHEHRRPQQVRLNIELIVHHPGSGFADEITAVLSYESLVDRIRKVAEAGHIKLIETLADRIADLCLLDLRVQAVEVRAEKLEVFPDAVSVGVVMKKCRSK